MWRKIATWGEGGRKYGYKDKLGLNWCLIRSAWHFSGCSTAFYKHSRKNLFIALFPLVIHSTNLTRQDPLSHRNTNKLVYRWPWDSSIAILSIDCNQERWLDWPVDLGTLTGRSRNGNGSLFTVGSALFEADRPTEEARFSVNTLAPVCVGETELFICLFNCQERDL